MFAVSGLSRCRCNGIRRLFQQRCQSSSLMTGPATPACRHPESFQRLAVRNSSSSSAGPLSAVPDVAPANVDVISAASSEAGDLATSAATGSGYSPVDLMQQYVTWLHESLGVPWWAAAGLLALTVRAALFPLQTFATVGGSRIVVSEKDMTAGKASFDEALTLPQKREVDRKMVELIAARKLHNGYRGPWSYWMVAGSLHGLAMYSLYAMSTMPSLSAALSTGGLLWISDLTVRDPLWILPAACIALSVVTSRTIAEKSMVSIEDRVRLNVHALTLNLLVAHFGTSLVQLYWLFGGGCHVLASLCLRLPPVARALDIPDISAQLKDNSLRTLLLASTFQTKRLPPVEELRAIAAQHREALAAEGQQLLPVGRLLVNKPVRLSFRSATSRPRLRRLKHAVARVARRRQE